MPVSKSQQGKRNRQNGYASEHRGEHSLEPFGFHRQVQSGKVKQLPGDLVREIPDGRVVQLIENKRREQGWSTLDKWLAQDNAQALRLDPGHGGPIKYVVPESVFFTLLTEAGYAEDPAFQSLADLLREAADRLDAIQT